jgi:hypothetical protein
MQNVTFEQLVGLLALALIMIGAYNTIMGAIKTHREEQKRKDAPVNNLEEQVKGHEEKLKRDNDRLKELEDGNRIMMRAMMALLSHDINGNSSEKLKQSLEEIQQYLIDK